MAFPSNVSLQKPAHLYPARPSAPPQRSPPYNQTRRGTLLGHLSLLLGARGDQGDGSEQSAQLNGCQLALVTGHGWQEGVSRGLPPLCSVASGKQ